MTTLAPMWTCEDIEMADMVLFGPGEVSGLLYCFYLYLLATQEAGVQGGYAPTNTLSPIFIG